ncbi:MAG: hypothetical protein JKX69_08575 [Rhodobacteraceae bacterium]|nr:hypothetical protein [Paracoccaceae bacterium]
MTHEERSNLIAIFSALAVIIYLALKLSGMNEAGAFAGPDAVKIWARTVLWIIPISIVSMIVLTILATILFAIVTNTPDPVLIVDERDRQIGSWGTKVSILAVSAGFIMSIIALAFFGWTALAALNCIFFSFAIGDLFGNLTKMFLWRRGV